MLLVYVLDLLCYIHYWSVVYIHH